MRCYSSAPIVRPEFIDHTPDGDIVELGSAPAPLDEGGAYYAPAVPQLATGLYDNTARRVGDKYTGRAFLLTPENVQIVTLAINHVRRARFLGVPFGEIIDGFAVAANQGIPGAQVQHQLVDAHIGDLG